MIYLKKYQPNDTYVSPASTIMDSEKVKKEFPAAFVVTHVVQTDASSQMMYGMYNLASMRSQYNIDSSLGEDEAIIALQTAMNDEREAQAAMAAIPSAEERIAAMMEYQALTTMSDIDV